MAIFGRRRPRRLRRAARQALTIPAFSAPADCAPWVLGGLWPAELATVTAETAAIADYLRADLQRIANSADEKLQQIGRAGLTGPDRQAAETQVLSAARRFAVLRVESTVRQLRGEPGRTEAPSQPPPEPPPEPASVRETGESPETDEQRLRRLLEFAARQEPGLRWAIGIGSDGEMLLATDLAFGWIPPGIDLPAGVRLPVPGRHGGDATALLGSTTAAVAYTPGDRLGWGTEVDPVQPSLQPLELPAVDDLGAHLVDVTHRRDGLPRSTNTLIKAVADGTGVAAAELDLLRVHLDTARYQLLAQYGTVDLNLLLTCMVLAAVERMAGGDPVSANYHFTWFEALSGPTR